MRSDHPNHPNEDDDDLDFLNLSLSTNPRPLPPPPAATSPPSATATSPPSATATPPAAAVQVGQSRRRPRGQGERQRNSQIIGAGKSENITPPYPWATTRRATVQSLQQLVAKGINTITGRVQCKRCDKQFDIKYDVKAKFREVAAFIMKNHEEMRHRAPAVWTGPTLPDCVFCEQHKCVKPVVAKKRNINWLFLFLGQMVGCCKLSELKYFCKHTKRHRTGAKDRVLYLTYLEISRQLDSDQGITNIQR